MNQKNFDFLKETLKYLGFDDKLNAELEKNMKDDNTEFRLQQVYEFNKKPIDATLYFKKGGQQELYYFNKYQATIKIKEEQRTTVFYIDKNSGVTLKEAFNLLQGRSVFKELSNKAGEVYKAWLQLDLQQKEESGNYKQKQFHENYGYDVVQAIEKLPIPELQDQKQKDILVKSLKKGNLQSVNFENEGLVEKMFIEANPQFKSITVYDGKMKKVIKKEASKKDVV